MYVCVFSNKVFFTGRLGRGRVFYSRGVSSKLTEEEDEGLEGTGEWGGLNPIGGKDVGTTFSVFLEETETGEE